MKGEFAKKSVLVTGGATGIGREVVDAFVAEGARVCVLDLNAEGLKEIETSHAESVITMCGDVREPTAHNAAVEAAKTSFGGLDILVGNAGIFDGYAKLTDLTEDQLRDAAQEIFAVNVTGYLLAARAAAPALSHSRGSMIFTVSSSAFYSETGGVLYAASKAAVVGIIRQLAYDFAPVVRVNGVSPGGTQTTLGIVSSLRGLPGIGKKASTSENSKERSARSRRRSPLGHAVVPEDHAASYLFLASHGAKLLTGSIIQTDGGLTARGIEKIAGRSFDDADDATAT